MNDELKNAQDQAGCMKRLVRHLGTRLMTRKHAENFAGNTHTATIKGEGIYGAGKSPAAARARLLENLEREGRLHLYLPNDEHVKEVEG